MSVLDFRVLGLGFLGVGFGVPQTVNLKFLNLEP